MPEVTLTPRAESDLFEIWSAIATENVRAADNLYLGIMEKARLAAENPQMGAPRPELSPTARILIAGRYIVIYEPLPAGVMIVAVVHGMRNPDSWLA